MPGLDPDADRRAVRRYAELTAEVERVRRERARLTASPRIADLDDRLGELARRELSAETERHALAPTVEKIVAWQIDRVLAEQGIRRSLLGFFPRSGFPFLEVELNPAVAFELGETPSLLVVAPRDRVQVVSSKLLAPHLSSPEVDRLEAAVDDLGVSSLVTPIGGLAAYPSMVPASSSVRTLLRTVSHEWVHHYLFFRPLGRSYFDGYAMRSINETVADVVGEELGDLVYDRFYVADGQTLEATPDRLESRRSTDPGQSAFPRLIREVRLEVERLLAEGDVLEAERYMAEQQQTLARQGYYVRRLNTAYLSFFGAYSGSANPFELRIETLRRQSGSLGEFLETAARIGSPAELDWLTSGQAGAPAPRG